MGRIYAINVGVDFKMLNVMYGDKVIGFVKNVNIIKIKNLVQIEAGRMVLDNVHLSKIFNRAFISVKSQRMPFHLVWVKNGKRVTKAYNCWISRIQSYHNTKTHTILLGVKMEPEEVYND